MTLNSFDVRFYYAKNKCNANPKHTVIQSKSLFFFDILKDNFLLVPILLSSIYFDHSMISVQFFPKITLQNLVSLPCKTWKYLYIWNLKKININNCTIMYTYWQRNEQHSSCIISANVRFMLCAWNEIRERWKISWLTKKITEQINWNTDLAGRVQFLITVLHIKTYSFGDCRAKLIGCGQPIHFTFYRLMSSELLLIYWIEAQVSQYQNLSPIHPLSLSNCVWF